MNTFARRAALWLSLIVGFVSFVSPSAHAQGTSGIAGVIREHIRSGASGVTVEAASPALIERTRAVVTDESGQYKIIDLPGGTYSSSGTPMRPSAGRSS